MGLLSNLKGLLTGPGGPLDGPGARATKVVSDDLGRLNGVDPGLGDAAELYVMTGEGETVFAALATHADAAGRALDLRGYIGYGGATATLQRHLLLGREQPWNEAIVARYLAVLAATAETDSLPGSKAVPLPLRVLFHSLANRKTHDRRGRPHERPQEDATTLQHVEALLPLIEAERDDLLEILFFRTDGWRVQSMDSIARELDAAHYLRDHLDRVPVIMARLPAAGREALVKGLEHDFAHNDAARGALLDALGDKSKTVREAAARIAERVPHEQLRAGAIERLGGGTIDARDAHATILGRMAADGDAEARAALQARLDKEKAARVRRTIELALAPAGQARAAAAGADDAEGYTALDGSRVAIPAPEPLPEAEPARPFTAAERDAYLEAARASHEGMRRQRERMRENAKTTGERVYDWMKDPGGFKGTKANRLLDFLPSDELPQADKKGDVAFEGLVRGPANDATLRRAFAQLFERLPPRRRIDLALAYRIARRCPLVCDAYRTNEVNAVMDTAVTRYLEDGGDLRGVADAAVALGVSHGQHVYGETSRFTPVEHDDELRQLLNPGWNEDATALPVPDAAVWPYVAVNLDVIDRVLGVAPKDTNEHFHRGRTLRLLAAFPGVPARYRDALVDIAVAVKGRDAVAARALLRGAGDIEADLIAMLEDGRQDFRAGAARLLAQQAADDPAAAVKALRARLKKEKSEIARAAQLSALARLGDDLSDLLGADALAAEAEKGLKKAKLDKLDWLDLSAVLPLHLADGTVLPDAVPRYWTFLADKLKQPGGNDLFALWLDQLAPDDRERLGRHILDAWIAKDTRGYEPAEVEELARQYAQSSLAHHKNYIQRVRQRKAAGDKHYVNADVPAERTLDDFYAEAVRDIRGTIIDTAAAHKGLLGLARGADPAWLATRARGYIRDHSQRTSQTTAVLDMLAATDHPAALQVVIATATRLKQKGVQAHAEKLVEAAAERRGWSRDELADRTVPTGGLDDEGRLPLPLGEDAKPYEARLGDDLSLTLRNPEGKPVKNLPAGRDDNTKASKKALTAARKAVKEIVALQSDRLYEAMCVERAWSPDDWRTAFMEHPVMRRLIERLVWIGDDGEGGGTVMFRPTPEGTLTDADDEDVALDGVARIRLAHAALVDEATREAWRTHLADYEVAPLVDQFGRDVLGVPDELRDDAITDREGWMSESYKLRSVLGKRGYTNSPPEDGGWYMEYYRAFPAAGLVAQIGFTGTAPGLENHPVAVTTLSFHRGDAKRYNRRAERPADVPPILLSEVQHDYREAAGTGGFDPDWERKGQY